jgi:hypothetical protein
MRMKKVHGSTERRLTMEKWDKLLRCDDEIRAAAEQLQPYGDFWVRVLGQVYFALNEDRKHLPSIVSRLVEKAKEDGLQPNWNAKQNNGKRYQCAA